MSSTWLTLEHGYPGEDPQVRTVFDVLAPKNQLHGFRCPIYEVWEQNPDPEEVWGLAEDIIKALRDKES